MDFEWPSDTLRRFLNGNPDVRGPLIDDFCLVCQRAGEDPIFVGPEEVVRVSEYQLGDRQCLYKLLEVFDGIVSPIFVFCQPTQFTLIVNYKSAK